MDVIMGIDDNSIGLRIKAIRTKQKLGQKEFALILNVGQSVVSDIEHGNISASKSVLSIMREKYNINLHWLLTGEGEMKLGDTKPPNEPVTDPANRLYSISSEINTIAKHIISTMDIPKRIEPMIENILALDDENFQHIEIEIRACLRQQERDSPTSEYTKKADA